MRVAVAVRSLALGVCVVSFVAVAERAPATGLDGFAGTWVRAERERDDAARDAVIQQATESMSFAFRGFARGVMRRRMRPPERYEVAQGAEAAWIRNDSGKVFLIDGRPHSIAENHEVTARFAGEGEIELAWKHGGESHGTAVFRLEEAGHRLLVLETVHDPHFEAPIAYSTSYQRPER